jgi:hypothetical protein
MGTRPRRADWTIRRCRRADRVGSKFAAPHMSPRGTSRHFAAKQQFGRYRGSSGHARRRFHIPSRNGVIVHRRPRRSKMALTRSVRPASKTRRFGRRVMRKCGSKNTSARMNRSRPRDRRTRDRLLRAHDSDGTVCVARNPPAHHPRYGFAPKQGELGPQP